MNEFFGNAYNRYTGKLKVETNFGWYWPWFWGMCFTAGYVEPTFSSGWRGLWELIQFLIVWPLFLGEALR